MRIIIITQDEPFYLAKNLNYLINSLPDHSQIVGCVVNEASPYGKKESFIKWANENSMKVLEMGTFSGDLNKTLNKLVDEANKTMWEFDIYGYHDSLQYTTYYGGGGDYAWHTDVGPMMANRKVSVVLQLTKPDEYEGGNLQLNGGNGIVEAPKDFNTMIIFPSFMLHRVTPVITGTRKSLVTWLAGPNLR